MKKIFCFLMAIVLMLGLTSCSLFGGVVDKEKQEHYETVLKNSDFTVRGNRYSAQLEDSFLSSAYFHDGSLEVSVANDRIELSTAYILSDVLYLKNERFYQLEDSYEKWYSLHADNPLYSENRKQLLETVEFVNSSVNDATNIKCRKIRYVKTEEKDGVMVDIVTAKMQKNWKKNVTYWFDTNTGELIYFSIFEDDVCILEMTFEEQAEMSSNPSNTEDFGYNVEEMR